MQDASFPLLTCASFHWHDFSIVDLYESLFYHLYDFVIVNPYESFIFRLYDFVVANLCDSFNFRPVRFIFISLIYVRIVCVFVCAVSVWLRRTIRLCSVCTDSLTFNQYDWLIFCLHDCGFVKLHDLFIFRLVLVHDL